MTGIYGLIGLEPQVDLDTEFERMSGAMRRFNPVSAKSYRHGQARLGVISHQAQLDRNGASEPFETNGWTFVSQARLDDRTEASRSVGLTQNQTGLLNDDRILAHGLVQEDFSNLGGCFGDWIQAAWHPQRQELRIAKEPYGQRPLYYVSNKRVFAFASNLGGLLALRVIDKTVDKVWVARSMLHWPSTGNNTVFPAIQFLPPATILCLKDGQISSKRYWDMRSSIQPVRLNYSEAVEAMSAELRAAVSRRVSDAGQAGSMLSSGLDSSSVTALAARELGSRGQTLRAYCSVPRYPDKLLVTKNCYGDESALAREVAEMYPAIDFRLCDAADLSPIDGIRATVETTCQPMYSTSNDHWLHSIFTAACAAGDTYVLAGFTGNLSFSWGYERYVPLAQLMLRRRWASVRARVLAHRALNPLRRWKQREIAGQLPWHAYSPISVNAVEQLDLTSLMRDEGHDPYAFGQPETDSLQERLAWFNPDFGAGVIADMQSQRYGLDILDATADTKLLLFCLGLPEHLYTGPNREPRWLARESASAWLPASIIENRRYGLQAADLNARLIADAAQMNHLLDCMERHELASLMIDIPRMRDIWLAIKRNNTGNDQIRAWSILLKAVCAGIFILKYT